MGTWSLPLLLALLAEVVRVRSQMMRETYETCTADEGYLAKCGPGANCFIIDGYPTCHCVLDIATGMPLAGNPYKACTWDITGEWQLYSYFSKRSGFHQEILSPISNEPFIIRLDRTDAILKTRYMTGAIFVITALSAFALGVCGRAFLDVKDNTTIIFEQAEGFLSGTGRGAVMRTALMDTSLRKMFPLTRKAKDRWNMWGKWQKQDGATVKVLKLKKPHGWPVFFNKSWRYWSAYWMNDDSFGAPLLRLSTALFLDKTLKSEQVNFQTDSRFIQTGWYGALEFGSQRISIYSPADGKEIFSLLKVDDMPAFTPFSRAAGLIGSQALQPTTTTYVGSSTTMSIEVEQPNATETAPGSFSDQSEVNVINRLADRPAPRLVGGAASTARREIISRREGGPVDTPRSLLTDTGSDLPDGFSLDEGFIGECEAISDFEGDEIDAFQLNPTIEEMIMMKDPSLMGAGSVRLGEAVQIGKDGKARRLQRQGPVSLSTMGGGMDAYSPTASQAAGQTWYEEIEARYQAALLFEKQQFEASGFSLF
eukprot:GHVN01069910.1.p1 GENE.GHVN01069910.1~~GHVN01069910.1.p1  ORF type:complete len:539 (-),score=63.79 GHVN01069910.1:1380-2996(-)